MRFAAQAFDVLHRVARRGPGTETRAADVDRIGAMVEGGNANIGIPGGGEEFEFLGARA
jgi:hypothetical protein